MREIEARFGGPEGLDVDLLAVPLSREGGLRGVERLDAWLEGALSRVRQGAFGGEAGEVRFVSIGVSERPDVLAVGTGAEPTTSPTAVRRAAGVAIRAARGHRAHRMGFLLPELPAPGESGSAPGESSAAPGEAATPAAPVAIRSLAQAAAEGLALGDWSYDELRGEGARERRAPPPAAGVVVVSEGAAEARVRVEEGVRRGALLAEVQNEVRAVVAQPGNIVTPRFLASAAERAAGRWGLRAQAWGPEKLREEGFGALLAVSRGSAEEPRFIILEHPGDGGDPYVVVGKGVTFDSGGISLKPSSGMESMKYDMAGAAAVLGVLQAAARLELPQRVIGLIPSAENLPSGTALKPGDVIRGLSNTSIEVVNTDAEGRLILSDALTFARRLSPQAVVDLATLTGGCVVALGHHAIGLMSPDDGLAAELEAAGRRSDERPWRLPLWPEYRKQLDSEIADLKNAGGREASPITAGWFLRTFAEGMRWAHLDIAGTAWAEEERGWQPKGATGVGVRLLVEWLSPT